MKEWRWTAISLILFGLAAASCVTKSSPALMPEPSPESVPQTTRASPTTIPQPVDLVLPEQGEWLQVEFEELPPVSEDVLLNGVYRIGIDGSEMRRISPLYVPATGASPDGKKIVAPRWDSKTRRTVLLFASTEGEPARMLALPFEGLKSPIWAPDSKYIAVTARELDARRPKVVAIVDVATGRFRRVYSKTPYNGLRSSVSWSPDGTHIAIVASAVGSTGDIIDQLRIVDLATGADHSIAENAFSPSWSPRGELIAYTRFGNQGSRDYTLTIVPADGGEPVPLTRLSFASESWAWSPSGDAIVLLSFLSGAEREVVVFDLESGLERTVGTVPSFAGVPAWSPDGERLLWHDGSALHVAEIDGSGLKEVYRPPMPMLNSAAWGPQGEILFTYGTRVSVVIEAGDGGKILSPGWRPMAISGDGSHIAFAIREPGADPLSGFGIMSFIYAMRTDGTELEQVGTVRAPRLQRSACPGGTVTVWSPDSRMLALGGLASAGGGDGLVVVDMDDGVTQEIQGGGFGLSWSPEGRRIVYGAQVGVGWQGTCEVHVLDVETGKIESITEGQAPVWSPDGQWIAFSKPGAIYLTRPDGSEIKEFVTWTDEFARFPYWSPDGKSIVVIRSRGGFEVVDVETRESGERALGRFFGWIPEGQTAITAGAYLSARCPRAPTNSEGEPQPVALGCDISYSSSGDIAAYIVIEP